MELCGWPNVGLKMREPGNWYMAFSAEIGGDGMLTSPTCAGKTPFDAINQTFAQLTELPDDRYLVVRKLNGDRRFRWNGFMWSDVTDETK